MRSMPMPSWDFSEAYAECIRGIIPLERRSRFQGISQVIHSLEHRYHDLARCGNVHEIEVFDVASGDAGDVCGEEFSDLYDSRLLSKKSSARNIYDRLRLSSPGNVCPYCGQSPVRTLDHYLPRNNAKFLSISPVNLIPCCRDCNSEKGNFFPATASEALIHPYYDHQFQAVDWLMAEIVEFSPVALRFYVLDDESVISKRAASHFQVLNLGFYYATHSAVELVNCRSMLETIFSYGGADAVRDELMQRLDSAQSANRNSWQTAFYRELSRSERFCDGGFLNISSPYGD